MAEKLKIIPLGGLDEIGKNCTVLEYGKDMIVIDCGVGFPEEDMYGVDLVIPDFSYLVANQKKLKGMFITHGHEDHIGSIPYAMQQINCPIHGTAMTNGLIKLKLEEHRIADKVKLITHKPGETVKAGCFSVEFIHVNHSIADAVAFAVKTPVGTVAAGYADGVPLHLTNKGFFRVNGKLCPILGRVTMDYTMISLENVPEAKAGDEVELFTSLPGDTLNINNWCNFKNTHFQIWFFR